MGWGLMEYCLVKRTINAVIIDSDDSGRDPDTIKVQGTVLFTPLLGDGEVVSYSDGGSPVSSVLAPISTFVNDGVIMHRGVEGIMLPAAGDSCTPSRIRWRAVFSNMQAGGWVFSLKPIEFEAVPGGVVDLTTVGAS